ncbi:unnamed protein product, partial [Pocillopora meandrina]
AEFEDRYPGCIAKNERYMQCVCGRDVQLNKPRVDLNFANHWKRQRCGEIESQNHKQKRMDLFLVRQPDRQGNTSESDNTISLEQ